MKLYSAKLLKTLNSVQKVTRNKKNVNQVKNGLLEDHADTNQMLELLSLKKDILLVSIKTKVFISEILELVKLSLSTDVLICFNHMKSSIKFLLMVKLMLS